MAWASGCILIAFWLSLIVKMVINQIYYFFTGEYLFPEDDNYQQPPQQCCRRPPPQQRQRQRQQQQSPAPTNIQENNVGKEKEN